MTEQLPPFGDLTTLYGVRRFIYQKINDVVAPGRQLNNADALDRIRDLATAHGLSFRLIKDVTGQHLSVYVWDEHGKFGAAEEFNPSPDPMKNPQWLGSVRRVQGADNIQGSKRW